MSLTYPDTGVKALSNVSFKIKKGQKVAIVGRTGSGKSTVANLLMRMYDPDEGNILIDGVPLREIKLDGYRKQIGYVPQDVFLFSDTVKNNIKFGHGEESGLWNEAAQMANVLEEVESLKNGFETKIGERGVTLSGGQKQRISLARALVNDPNILILDDSLSAVDTKTEKAILGSLNKILKDKTAIIITHRIFTLLQFDKIVVLDEGALVEYGSHVELIQQNGLYKQLYDKQKIEESIS